MTADNGSGYEQLIHFVYRLLFNRDAEPIALSHWQPYLEQGLSPLDFFEALWRSDEFSEKAEQNRYIKPPRLTIPSDTEAIISDEYFDGIVPLLAHNRNSLLEIKSIRALVAQWRYRDLMEANGIKFAESEEAWPDTATYSEATLRNYVHLDRSNDMIRPLPSIGRIAKNLGSLKVLAIGPRTEMELFALLAAGFSLNNISMIDLISYSPYVKVGDMHHMGYKDEEFDVIVFGETLAYSQKPEIAVQEILRVAKNKAIVSIVHAASKGHVPLLGGEALPVNERQGLFINSTEDMIRFFEPHVGHVYLRCEPEVDGLDRIVTTFEILKNKN
jgi:SAM-dependent methyltransferase